MTNTRRDTGIQTPPLHCDPTLFPGRQHIIQVYDREYDFMEALECYVTCGLRAGEGVVLFATARHLQDLQIRLDSERLELDRASWQSRYIPVLASEALSKFMVDGWPDERVFRDVIGEVLDRAQGDGRNVRVFGEVAGLLMQQGELEATVRVEQLWNRLCRERKLTLFCAYPRACFPPAPLDALEAVCSQHSWMLDAHSRTSTSIPGSLAKPLPYRPETEDIGDDETARFDYGRRLDSKRDEAIAFDIMRDQAIANAMLDGIGLAADVMELPLALGAESATAWSIPGTVHSNTGTRWVLSPVQ